MPTELTVTNEDPIDLNGFLDGTSALQFTHDSVSLASCEQTLEAEHDDYNESGGLVRVRLLDFATGGNTWTLTATHSNGSVTWTRNGNHAYFDFSLITGLVEVDVVATHGAQSKTRKFWIKTTPTDPLPDGD